MKFVWLMLSGTLGGILTGLGMGGGTVTLPLLVLVFGVGQFTAQFANLLAFLPSGSVALFMHLKNNFVEEKPLRFILPTSFIACFIASFFASKASGVLLKQLFGGFLILLAAASFIFKLAGNFISKNK